MATNKRPKDLRKPTGMTKLTENAAVKRFFGTINQDVFRALCMTSDNEKFRMLAKGMEMKFRPNGGRPWEVLRLCQELGINLLDLNKFYTDQMLHVAQINIMEKVPDIMMSIADESLPGSGTCPRCNGEKVVDNNGKRRKKCPECLGAGKIATPGNMEARKMLWNQFGLIKSGTGPTLNQQINVSGVPDIRQVIDVRQKLLEEGE